jgi:hypothetical protein
MKNVLHYILVLDQSGSMNDIKDLAISSFNEQVDSIGKIQRQTPEIEIRITLCTFNDEVKMVSFFEDIDNLSKLSHSNYHPRSMTALYDAIGYTYQKATELADKQQKVIMAIFTDGLENASKEYTAADISRIIETAEMKGWDIRFFCRYEDRIYHKTQLNIPSRFMMSMHLDEDGFKKMAHEVENSVRYFAKQMK